LTTTVLKTAAREILITRIALIKNKMMIMMMTLSNLKKLKMIIASAEEINGKLESVNVE